LKGKRYGCTKKSEAGVRTDQQEGLSSWLDFGLGG
jgi:hypothetical protein